ncbi:hypothetical protein EJ06DRAFT_517261 [Trichodelitschia bisporula]|uniref:DNA repair and recombination protein RAD26 n=1 Tax=Trichodelitschia bisporula TaxID=703511 RepID=A0A6G1HJ75_9PEZI|nr:hypothetical protein EJ06DRAFT_517261 [Trichodelitschia bisporula]
MRNDASDGPTSHPTQHHIPRNITIMKPFKPPFIRKRSDPTTENLPMQPTKRRRTSSDDNDTLAAAKASALPSKPSAKKTFLPPRKPLQPLQPLPIGSTADKPPESAPEGYYNVLWRKYTLKKHKTWDGDGVLSVSCGYATLQDVDGRHMGRVLWKSSLLPGSTLSVGGKEVEVDSVISKADFMAGRPFLRTEVPIKAEPEEPQGRKVVIPIQTDVKKNPQTSGTEVAPKIPLAGKKFQTPLMTRPAQKPPTSVPKPQLRHDPDAPGALVMRRPDPPKGKQIVDVVVDPFLSKHLREHQREGVKFMYECVMGMAMSDGLGAILADDMGLGKTLQTIALLWTLLKQNPIAGSKPVIRKALIVCPVTLINNWRKEFKKWLGTDRIGVFVADDKNRLTDFTRGKAYSIMIVGYEKLRSMYEDLQKYDAIDIIIADEGHRLKTARNKAALAIKSFATERRIILSGTPLQNDLSEFFAMVDVVNPGLLGKYTVFKREFEDPIVRSRQPEAGVNEVEKGEARSQELARLTGLFILRRTADVISKYLPPKTETVLFCHPTAAQAAIYQAVLDSPMFGSVLGSPEASLQLISILKKLCNSPSLLKRSEDKPEGLVTSLLESLPPKLLQCGPATSSKLLVVDALLHRLRTTTSEKIVLVSNYTATLDMLGALLAAQDYHFLRLDGTTPPTKRQGLVDRFNKADPADCFAFLLSARAGGAGLNLIGASRLVLFDVDWNPATDKQAMARIHRDGQTRPCFIYTLLIKGALDEKIFQRQVTKMGLADAVVDSKKTSQAFTRDELRDLFRLDLGESCQTHDLLGCSCGGRGELNEPVVDVEVTDTESLPEIGTLLSASQVDMEWQERRLREMAAEKRAANGTEGVTELMKYAHVDAKHARGEEEVASLIEDAVLLEALREQERVGYLFVRTTG